MSSVTLPQYSTKSLGCVKRRRSQTESSFSEYEPPAKYAASIKWYNIVLDSSSSSCSDTEHDTESVYSLQDKETDIAQDTPDTASEQISDSECDVVVEFEVDSSTSEEETGKNFWRMRTGHKSDNESSSGTDDILSAGVLAAIVSQAGADDDMGVWAADTDGENDNTDLSATDGDNSNLGPIQVPERKHLTGRACVRCGAKNDGGRSLLFRYCDKCYQHRKAFLPPRPRRFRKRNLTQTTSFKHPKAFKSLIQTTISEPIMNARKCEDRFDSLDSGVSCMGQLSSSDALSEIRTSETESDATECTQEKDDEKDVLNKIDDKPVETLEINERKNVGILMSSTNQDVSSQTDTELSQTITDEERNDLCITCHMNPKNGIFVHGSIAHQCCCYKCSVKVWSTTKKCPICNQRVSNILKGFFY